MQGKLFYFAIAALLGILSSFEHRFLLILIFIFYFLFLYWKKNFSLLILSIVIAMFCIFYTSSHYTSLTSFSKIDSTQSSFQLKFEDKINIDGDILKAEATEMKYKEKILVTYKLKTPIEKERIQNWARLGMICRVKASLKLPENARNPYAFNYQKYLSRKKIYWIAEIQTLSHGHCTHLRRSPLTMIKQMREDGISQIQKTFPSEVSPLAAALIFGERSFFPPEIIASYQKIGIMHLLAISGLHVSLLAGMLFYVGIRAGLTRESMKMFLYIMLPVYAVLAGGAPSVYRSVIMVMITMIFSQRGIGKKVAALDAISFTFLLMALFDPLILYDVGFQLSFCVSGGIILSAAHIIESKKSKTLQLIMISYISQLLSLPIILHNFFYFSFIGLVANLIFVPLFSFVMMPSLFLLFFLQLILKNVPKFALDTLSLLIIGTDEAAKAMSALKFSDVSTGRFSFFISLILAIIIIFVFISWEKTNNLKKLALIMLLPWLFIVMQKVPAKWNEQGTVTIIDVGQGDSILIELPKKKGVYLIDTGGTINFGKEKWQYRSKQFEVGRDVIIPFLRAKGIEKIDKLLLTHGDSDHIGGSLAVMKNIEIKEILMPDVKQTTQKEIEIRTLAQQMQIPVYEISAGYEWEVAGTKFHVLNPESGFEGEKNSGSIVLFTRLGGENWLFTGDLDENAETKLITNYPKLSIDVLKVAHHGSHSSTSRSFIQALRPKIALISVAKENRYGHPHREVIGALEEVNCTILRTDINGAILYQFSGEYGTFYTSSP